AKSSSRCTVPVSDTKSGRGSSRAPSGKRTWNTRSFPSEGKPRFSPACGAKPSGHEPSSATARGLAPPCEPPPQPPAANPSAARAAAQASRLTCVILAIRASSVVPLRLARGKQARPCGRFDLATGPGHRAAGRIAHERRRRARRDRRRRREPLGLAAGPRAPGERAVHPDLAAPLGQAILLRLLRPESRARALDVERRPRVRTLGAGGRLRGDAAVLRRDVRRHLL